MEEIVRGVVAVQLSRQTTAEAFDKLVRSLPVTPLPVNEQIYDEHVRVLRFDERKIALNEVLSKLEDRVDLIRASGAIAPDASSVVADPSQFTEPDQAVRFLTREIVVKFSEDASQADIEDVFQSVDLVDSFRPQPFLGKQAYVARVSTPAGDEVLSAVEALSVHAEWAEPNAIATAVDATHPGDLYYQQQHTELSGLSVPCAWERLDQEGIKYGSPDIVVAIMDKGIDKSHEEFAGKIGQLDKVSTLFDFKEMLDNNDSGKGKNHGMYCAGVALATPDVGGLAGVAGHCRAMGLIRPSSDLDYAKAYLWAAGIPPDDWNVPLPEKPADVISSSFRRVSSTAIQEALDRVAAEGRGQKGTVLTFPYNSPMAEGENCTRVSPSSKIGEAHVYTAVGFLTTTWSGFGDPGLQSNYEKGFGNTSCAVALTAGVAALVLSAAPKLTWDQVRKLLVTTSNGGPIDADLAVAAALGGGGV